jgi:hypothetical protein
MGIETTSLLFFSTCGCKETSDWNTDRSKHCFVVKRQTEIHQKIASQKDCYFPSSHDCLFRKLILNIFFTFSRLLCGRSTKYGVLALVLHFYLFSIFLEERKDDRVCREETLLQNARRDKQSAML